MYGLMETMGSRLLDKFVPRIEASAMAFNQCCGSVCCWDDCWQCAHDKCCVDTRSGALTCGTGSC
ncbi:hypothetical protein GZH49_29880 [Nocardia terpenica]|uniref:hypothetical protein n=1 Tax=Nocardia terpenica TaxID=455432 RepID=UPI002FE2E092